MARASRPGESAEVDTLPPPALHSNLSATACAVSSSALTRAGKQFDRAAMDELFDKAKQLSNDTTWLEAAWAELVKQGFLVQV
jgi:hypothetical protein